MASRPPPSPLSPQADPRAGAPAEDADRRYLALAMDQAHLAAAAGEVPVGAVLVEAESGRVLAAAHNRTETDADPTAHAEVLAIRAAGMLRGRPRLPDCDLYVTLEPCALCAAAISFARIRRLVYGAPDAKMGGVAHGPRFYEQPTCHHRPEIVGPIDPEEPAALLRTFFRARRQQGKRGF